MSEQLKPFKFDAIKMRQIARLKRLLSEGASQETVLLVMRELGFSQGESQLGLEELTGMSSREAKRAIVTCEAWRDHSDANTALHNLAERLFARQFVNS